MLERRFALTIHDQSDTGWQLSSSSVRSLLAKFLAQGSSLSDLVSGRMHRGLQTGLHEAFIITQATRDRLVAADPQSANLLKPIRRGKDLRPWYQENEGRWLIRLPSGWTAATFGTGLDEAAAWRCFSARHATLTAYLAPYTDAARRHQDKGQYWWELRSCTYYSAFEQPGICWPELSGFPRFSWVDGGTCVNDKGYILPTNTP